MEIELYSKLNNPVEAISRIGEIFSKVWHVRMQQGRTRPGVGDDLFVGTQIACAGA
jgi:hypothetical protein